MEMLRVIVTIFMIVLAIAIQAQSTYITRFKSEAHSRVYITKYKHEADCVLHVSSSRSEANFRKGVIYFEKYKARAEWIVEIVQYKAQADCIVYFTQQNYNEKENSCFNRISN